MTLLDKCVATSFLVGILVLLAMCSTSAHAETRQYPSRTGWQVEFHWPPGSAPQVFDATNWSTGRGLACIADGSGFIGLAFNNVNGEHDFVVLEVPAKYRSGRHWCVRLGRRLARGKGPWPQGMRAEP